MTERPARLKPEHMKSIRQNPMLLWPAIILSAAGVVMLFSMPIAGIDFQLWGCLVFIPGLLLQHTGTDLALRDDGIKFGFTKISWSSIDHIDLDSDAQIVIVTRIGIRRSFTLARWHYHPSDWQTLRERLGKIQPV